MIRRILPLGLLLVFAVYGYSQNSTAVASKETKTTKCTSACPKYVDKNGDGKCAVQKDCSMCKGKENCSGKEMKDCKSACTGGHGKEGCGAAGSGCGKGSSNAGSKSCPNHQGSGNSSGTSTTPTK